MAESTNRVNSTKMVWVGCKLPNGLLMEIIPERTPEQNSNRESPAFHSPLPAGRRIHVKGANSIKNDLTMRNLAQIDLPYAITLVPADLWEAWMKRHGQSQMVTGGFVFAVNSEKDAKARGKEGLSEKTGFEALNPSIELDTRLNRNTTKDNKVSADPDRLAELRRLNAGDPS